jgi:hypothetical protein
MKIVVVCHCPSHEKLYTLEKKNVVKELPQEELYYVDPSCKQPWSQVPNNSIDIMFGIHCPIYHILYKENTFMYNVNLNDLLDILKNARKKLKMNASIYFLLDEEVHETPSKEFLSSLSEMVNGRTLHGRLRKHWRVSIVNNPKLSVMNWYEIHYNKAKYLCFEKI